MDQVYGRGRVNGTYKPTLRQGSGSFVPAIAYTTGDVELQFSSLKTRPPFNEESVRREYLDRMNMIPGVSMSRDELGGLPSFKIDSIASDEGYAIFESALDWFVDQVRQPNT